LYHAKKRNARLHENNHKDRESTLMILIGEVIFATWHRVGDSAKNGNLHAGWASTHTHTHIYLVRWCLMYSIVCPPQKTYEFISSTIFLFPHKKEKTKKEGRCGCFFYVVQILQKN
jgi:hypothetical protein